MRLLYIFITTVFFSTFSYAQKTVEEEKTPYDYDTTLIGGYKISFQTDDSLQYLYLVKDHKKITQLASTSRGMLYKNLGYVGADFKDYFVLVHSFGSGNPNCIKLIRKSTGHNILKQSAAWIDVVKKQGILLYSDKEVPSPRDKMILYDVHTGLKQLFNFPNDIFNEPADLSRIQIIKLTNKQLIIKYNSEKSSKTKVYSR